VVEVLTTHGGTGLRKTRKNLSDSKYPSINMAASTVVAYRDKDGGFQHLL
jgi:hypothetical protein